MPPAGADLLGGQELPTGWRDPKSRAGRVRACLEELRSEREAAEAAVRAQGQAYLDALQAGTAAGRTPAAVAVAAQQIRVQKAVAAQQALIDDWEARGAAGAGSRLGRRPVVPDDAADVRAARARLAGLQAAAEAEAAAGEENGKKPSRARNLTDPDSRLLPVRGGGFIQGYNCQDAAADDRMLGGYASRTPATCCRHRKSTRSPSRAPPSSPPPTPPTPATRPCCANATTACAPARTRTAPATISPPATPR